MNAFEQYFLYRDNRQDGPFTLGQVKHMWKTGIIHQQTLFWQEGYDEWEPLSLIQDLIEEEPAAAAPAPGQPKPSAEPAPPGWGPASYLALIILTFIIPIIGLIIGIMGAFDPAKRQQGGTLIALSILAGFIHAVLYLS